MQYGKLYEEGTRILADAGIEEREAKLDARFLLEHVCGTTLQTLLLNKERAVSEEEEGAYRDEEVLTWQTITEQQCRQLVARILRRNAKGYREGLFESDGSSAFRMERITEICGLDPSDGKALMHFYMSSYLRAL